MRIIKMKKKNPKQIAAIVCLVLIALSYIALIVVSLLDSSKSGELFQACLIATVFLPDPMLDLYLALWPNKTKTYDRRP